MLQENISQVLILQKWLNHFRTRGCIRHWPSSAGHCCSNY